MAWQEDKWERKDAARYDREWEDCSRKKDYTGATIGALSRRLLKEEASGTRPFDHEVRSAGNTGKDWTKVRHRAAGKETRNCGEPKHGTDPGNEKRIDGP